MQKRWTVAILGSSLLMAGLEASLRRHDALQVLSIDGSRQDVGAQLAALRPDVVIFDLHGPEARLLLDPLPGLPMLLLGVAGNTVLAYTCHAQVTRSAHDLVELIEREVGRLQAAPDGSGGVCSTRGAKESRKGGS